MHRIEVLREPDIINSRDDIESHMYFSLKIAVNKRYFQLPLSSHQTKKNQRMDAETNQHPRTTHREDKNTVGRTGGDDRLKTEKFTLILQRKKTQTKQTHYTYRHLFRRSFIVSL